MGTQFVKRARTLLAVLPVLLAACTGGGLSNSVAYSPPPPLALVALIDPASDQLPAELQLLAGVIRTAASPNEAIVVMLLAPGARSYTVRAGDSLSSIAAANGLTLGEVEAANPQFGPVAGRNWSVIHTGELITIRDPTAPNPLLLVTKAPEGPPPPMLIRPPQRPKNPTDYQRAQYEHAMATDNATNSARVAAWRANADAALVPWQSSVAARLANYVAPANVAVEQAGSAALSASMSSGLATLTGLAGHRLLLVLGGGGLGPSQLAPRSLTGIKLVVANVSDPGIAGAWTSAAREAGAESVSALDPALTQLQLAQVVNS